MKNQTINKISNWNGILALSPIFIFLSFYLGLSIYVGDFYKVPISVAFIVGTVWALLITKCKFAQKIEIFSKGAAHSNILFMIWIFILAGAFASIAKAIGAIDATVGLTLTYIPSQFIVPGLFFAACLISLSIGTSVGTVTAIVPLAVDLAIGANSEVAFYVGAVLCGSFFGDNLSFISDTTIAATRTQGCKMNSKFKTNIWIALPAAIIVIGIYLFLGLKNSSYNYTPTDINYILILPYLLVLICAIAGMNVIKVLSIGIVSSIIIGLSLNQDIIVMCLAMGNGIEDMGSLIIITLLAAGLLALIEYNNGIKYLIQWLTLHINGKKGAMGAIASLVAMVNICTANNTIAIITVGNLSKN
ncbi:MAG: Na+/H+ antiporter NhaC family protein, partial [Muribaculaceae bacterium]|nr:Na+/H+ antiporter NhaC family protein [Muribaculaceae bacterium]